MEKNNTAEPKVKDLAAANQEDLTIKHLWVVYNEQGKPLGGFEKKLDAIKFKQACQEFKSSNQPNIL